MPTVSNHKKRSTTFTILAMEHTTVTGDGEAQPAAAASSNVKRGGWIAFPFIIGSVAGLTLGGGWLSNLIVYLIYEFNVKSIDAAQISNVVSGSSTLIPVLAAILADSFLGCFSVILISSIVSLLGLILHPDKCENDGPNICPGPTTTQYATLYICLATAIMGQGGTHYTLATMGANQFTEPNHQNSFFNWYFFTSYIGMVVSSTGIVYIEDNAGWVWGSGLCLVANAVGLVVFLTGSHYYFYDKPQGSPFVGLAQVLVASARKRKAAISSETADYYYGDGDKGIMKEEAPTKSFRSLNRAALKSEGDIQLIGSIVNPWKLCTVQQVEDFKNLIRILPLWSTSILLATPIGIQMSLSVLQSLTMDRHVGPHFQIPAASILVFTLIASALCLSLFDHILWPACTKLLGRNLTPLHRLGTGHVLNIASMVVSALVESKRRGKTEAMSVSWLVPQLAIVGIAEAFHYPGQVALYYQEFPKSLKNMSTAMISLLIAIAFYLSAAVIDLVRRVTNWLPDNINNGRVDNVYWVLVVLGILNFAYYLLCSWIYKYKNVEEVEGDD